MLKVLFTIVLLKCSFVSLTYRNKQIEIMTTIKMYTSENFTATSGTVFNIYKGANNVGEAVFTIRDEQKNELGFRKSKKAIENFLAKN